MNIQYMKSTSTIMKYFMDLLWIYLENSGIYIIHLCYIYIQYVNIYICVYIQDMWGSDDDAHKIRLSDNDIFLVIMHVVMCRMKMPYLR